ncbi:unnamed protein product, partial [Mesorhabditis belari]|uniref:C6 domain-containing protein n=1 Tax=Mesorhabditis belari TaxID=2138241 RepID=A0AAF3EWT9_9BILA
MVALSLFLSLISPAFSCIPTRSPTTKPPCCPMLSTTSLPRRAPTNLDTYEQCSILRRMSSTCPIDGIVFCEAAPDTNPAGMQIQFFNAAGNVVRTVTTAGDSLAVKVTCWNGVFTVLSGGINVPITSVSCAQTGSQGLDDGYVLGSAIS